MLARKYRKLHFPVPRRHPVLVYVQLSLIMRRVPQDRSNGSSHQTKTGSANRTQVADTGSLRDRRAAALPRGCQIDSYRDLWSSTLPSMG
jgi:hypothetical protein